MTPSRRLVGRWAGPEDNGRRGVGRREGSPVHHGASVEGHEEDLAAASGAHRCEEHLHGRRGERWSEFEKKNHSIIIVRVKMPRTAVH